MIDIFPLSDVMKSGLDDAYSSTSVRAIEKNPQLASKNQANLQHQKLPEQFSKLNRRSEYSF